MGNINIDSKLLEALQQSTCFGIAYDETAPECKMCDVRAQCKAKTEGGLNIPTPVVKSKASSATSKPATKKPETKKTATSTSSKTSTASTSKPKPKTASVPSNGNIPDFKPMSLDELKDLAKERNVDWKDYGNDNITRMRLIMALKKSY